MPTVTREQSFELKSKQFNKLVSEPVWQAIYNLNEFRVITNLVDPKELGFIRGLKRILQKDTGCGFNPKDKLDIYTRTIETKKVKVNMQMCADELEGTILNQTKKNGIMRDDLTGTQMGAALVLAVRDALPQDFLSLFWFGNEGSEDPFYNIVNGMWAVYLTQLAEDNLSPYVDTNSGSALAPGAAQDLLEEMHASQSQVLRGLPDSSKRYYVTKSVYVGWGNDQLLLGNGESSKRQLIDGFAPLTYKGIPLVENPDWDDHTTNDLNQPHSHLALLTIPDNLVVATNQASDMNRLDFWYDKKDERNYLKVKARFGANYVHPAFFVIGY